MDYCAAVETRLGDRNLRALLEFATELQAVERLSELPDVLLPALLRLVGADLAGWNDIDLASGTFDGHLWPDRSSAAAFAGLSELPDPPPLLSHFAHHPQAAPARISDVCDQRTWHATPAYVEVYRRFGVEAQIAFPVTATATRIGAVALNRDRLDFTDAERDLLEAARPQIEIAHRRLLRTAARETARTALGTDTGWLLIDGAGRIVDLDAAAAALLAAGGCDAEPGRHLAGLPGGVVHRRLDGPADDGTILLAVRPGTSPAALGLTPRQYDVLRAVADGATAAIAARRLGISPHTLTTHLRDAYAALGVTGRVAALEALRKHGLLDP